YVAKRLEEILGKKEIDVLVLTHVHIDHHGGYKRGGIWSLIENYGFTFKKYVDRDIGTYNGKHFSDCDKDTIDWKYVGSSSSTAVQWVCYATSSIDKTKLSSIREIAQSCSTTQIQPPDANSEIQIIMHDALGVNRPKGDPVAANLIDDPEPPNENDYSICLRVKYGNFVYATCGDLDGTFITSPSLHYYDDIESPTAPMMGEVDLMNVNHHGSEYSSNENWTQTLKPTVSVISCGLNNKFNHPHINAMTRINEISENIFLTNDCYAPSTDPFPNAVKVNGDVIVIVPENGTRFLVKNQDATIVKTYVIKKNKAAKTKCKEL
ncbi:competence protein comec, putative, partial [Entamoeba invadens IP1]